MSVSAYPLSHRFLLGRARHRLSEHERGVVEGLITDVERFTSAHVVLERGDVVSRSTLLIEGFVARVINEGGRRHIVALHVPGDFVDLHAFALKRLDHSIVSIGPVMVGYTTHKKLEGLMQTEPHLSRMLWFSTLLDAAMHREWIMKLEHLSADGRLAHLIAEIWQRLDFVGLADPGGFPFPLTQQELADSCGTTAIHMNRVVRKLRENGIAEISRGRVTVLDKDALIEAGGFDPSYLYGKGDLMLD
ncbi:Crp/Fnr family transcriptional regulator [Pararhodobacter sp. CCB-MM2]|uniref:Crp/Fnr family transcriptional regulator n=1 Tax=Pararhodobacter sp. CCB-MM2 TaxID=1786003 RepID=UPI00082D0BE4|nr:Crp/Fnr family transcriptional regulator [Pararhodobacter sp. CCB-MM2]MCA2011592.1 Crp/Fnr family transcriptional regulator [Cereibacter sphaeroides]